MSSRIIIVDGNHLVCRCVYATHDKNLSNSYGDPTGGVYTFLKNINYLIDDYHAHVCVVFDGGHSKYRKEIYPDYKKKESEVSADELSEEALIAANDLDEHFNFTFNYLKKILPHFGIPVISFPGEEADDIIFIIAKYLTENTKDNIFVYSGDEDYIQFIKYGISVINKNKLWNRDNFSEYANDIPIESFVLWKSLQGDGSDNIPGIFRVGPATATKIIKQLDNYDIESVKKWADSGDSTNQVRVRNFLDQLEINLKLIDLGNCPILQGHSGVTYDKVINDFKYQVESAEFNMDLCKSYFQYLEIKSLSGLLISLAN